MKLRHECYEIEFEDQKEKSGPGIEHEISPRSRFSLPSTSMKLIKGVKNFN